MSNYGGYGGNGAQGYGQANPYDQEGGRYDQGAGNPYAQQGGNPYAQQQQQPPPQQPSYGGGRTQPSGYNSRPQEGGYDNRYGGGRPQAPAASNGSYAAGNDMEMGPMNGQTNNAYNSIPPPSQNPNAILDECREIDTGIGSLQSQLEEIRRLQQAVLDDSDGSQYKRRLDEKSAEVMAIYKNLGARIKGIKQQKESGNPKNKNQVGFVDRKLKSAIQQYQQLDRDFRHNLSAQMERQYRIVRPDASEQEVREAVEDTSNTQVFSQALMSSNRQGQAQSAMRAVQGRHDAIRKIESQMIELAQLFQDLEAAVVQQEPAVEIIDQKAEDTQMNIGKGNEQLDQAVVKARSARKKKWICLGIFILIILVIAAIIAIAVVVTNHNK